MHDNPKQKTCWNCESNVTLIEENCPSCSVYLSPLPDEGQRRGYSILIPPYNISEEEPQKEIPSHEIDLRNKADEESEKIVKDVSIKSVVAILSFLFLGSILLLFGVFMLVFSQNNALILKWNASYWYVYLGLSLPLLFLGWRGLNLLSE